MQNRNTERSQSKAMKNTSVALTTYNGEKYIARQLESILSQSILPDEIVICDDISTDSTTSIINRFQDESQVEIRLTQNNENLGSIKNFEKAISLCKGKIIFLSDQDDVWRNDRIQATLDAFEENPESGFFFSNAGFINEQDEALAGNLWDGVGFSSRKQSNFTNLETQALVLRSLNIVTGATMAFKSELRKYFLPIPIELKRTRSHHDGWIAARLSLLGFHGISSKEPLINYRLHSKQQVGVKEQHGSAINTRRAMNPTEGIRHELSIINLLIDQENYGATIDKNIQSLKAHLESRIRILNSPRHGRIKPLLSKLIRSDYKHNKYPLLSAVKDLIY